MSFKPPSSLLCSVCKPISETPINSEQSWPHHETLESFRIAIQYGCYICSAVWRDLSETDKNALRDGLVSWHPMSYLLYEDNSDDESRFVALSFAQYLGDEYSHRQISTRFWMSPHEGQYSSVLYVSSGLTNIGCLDGKFPSMSSYPSMDSATLSSQFLELIRKFPSMFSYPYMDNATSSSQTLEHIRNWCLSCRANHKGCSRFVQQDGWNPTRLVDIGNPDETEWKLHFPLENGLPRPAYITLSYRWGSDDDFKLTENKLRTGFRGQIEDLPQTFRDAVTVARLFSVRYLWIDRLCIVQDSKSDWEHESVQMRRVYANSFCNIAASASTSPKGGLFRTRNPEDTRPGRMTGSFGTSNTMTYNMIVKNYLEHQVLAGPLHRRGWVFQERILAPRTIHFAEDQVFWECFTELKCEAFPEGIPFHYPLKANLDLSSTQQSEQESRVLFLWGNLVEQYTRCEFTMESDKLVAFSGIAQLFRDLTGDEYVAGMWRCNLAEQLCWSVSKPKLMTSSEYRAPSWSWASTSGSVDPGVFARGNEAPQIHIIISDIQIQSSVPNSMGTIISGEITLEGCLIQANWTSTDQYGELVRWIEPCDMEGTMSPDVLGTGIEESRSVACLPVRTRGGRYSSVSSDDFADLLSRWSETSFLVLEALSSASNKYRRVGYLELHFENWMEKSGITVNRDGKTVYSADGKTSTIRIV